MGERDILVNCTLRETEKKKEKFDIEAILFVNVDGNLYKVDSSTQQGIYREPSFGNILSNWLFWTSIVVVIVLVIIGLSALIVRILYPLYKKKKVELKKEMKKLEKEEGNLKKS